MTNENNAEQITYTIEVTSRSGEVFREKGLTDLLCAIAHAAEARRHGDRATVTDSNGLLLDR